MCYRCQFDAVIGDHHCGDSVSATVLRARKRTERAAVPDGALRLVILTPHNEQIRYEIGLAFSKWHQSRHGGAGRLYGR